MTDDVPTSVFDSANRQHMVTYTVAFGVEGLLSDSGSDGWPDLSSLSESSDWGNPSNSDPEKIDDLWHAAYNSKGSFTSAATPQEVADALSDALGDVEDRSGSAASVGFNTSTLTGSSSVYLAQFNSSNNAWTGDLFSFPLNSGTGAVGSTVEWTAASALDAMASPANSRVVMTYNGSGGIPFQWANLTSGQQDDLKTNTDGSIDADPTLSAAKGLARLNYIRGDRTNEVGQGGAYSFRGRNKLLGDIIHSSPVMVGVPQLSWRSISPFPSTTGTNTYDDFKNGAAKNRTGVVYVGANDGMLHGFNATDGSELLAYIPASIYSTSSATTGLHYLTDTDYTHRFYVDLDPTVSDVYMDMGKGANWHTILIGGERGGGRGLFALDITDPSNFSEASAADLVLWEFDSSDDSDLGYTFSKPSIVMMNNGKWAAIVGNGYNTFGDGKAKLFILFLQDGLDGTWASSDYIEISTETGTIASGDCTNAISDCNGLSTPQVVDLDGDYFADRIYAGDLKGNMWAFDVSGNATSTWKVAYKSGATPKPLFTAS